MWVRRLTADDGEALIERVLDAEQVRTARASFVLNGGPAMTGEEAFEVVMGRGPARPLVNGWRLARRRIMGADRVEIEGAAGTDAAPPAAVRRSGRRLSARFTAPIPPPPRNASCWTRPTIPRQSASPAIVRLPEHSRVPTRSQ